MNVAMSSWILAILFALIFRLVPDVRLPWKPIFVGAVPPPFCHRSRGVLDLRGIVNPHDDHDQGARRGHTSIRCLLFAR